jgi:hypothetical protein
MSLKFSSRRHKCAMRNGIAGDEQDEWKSRSSLLNRYRDHNSSFALKLNPGVSF